MKTLGQIAREAHIKTVLDVLSKTDRIDSPIAWEAAAQAVREAVIEECARACEAEIDHVSWKYDDWLAGSNAGYKAAAIQIRALKDKK